MLNAILLLLSMHAHTHTHTWMHTHSTLLKSVNSLLVNISNLFPNLSISTPNEHLPVLRKVMSGLLRHFPNLSTCSDLFTRYSVELIEEFSSETFFIISKLCLSIKLLQISELWLECLSPVYSLFHSSFTTLTCLSCEIHFFLLLLCISLYSFLIPLRMLSYQPPSHSTSYYCFYLSFESHSILPSLFQEVFYDSFRSFKALIYCNSFSKYIL